MTDDIEHIESERFVDPETPFARSKYRIKCRCPACGKEFSKVVSSLAGPPPECPSKACKEAKRQREIQIAAENMAKIILEQRAPGIIGANPTVKAVDQTAEWTMEGYGLTDLKSDVRVGETVAPSLPQRQQEAADNFFKPKKVVDPVSGMTVPAQHLNRVARKAMAGMYARRAVAPTVISPGVKPGEKGLVHVHTHKP